MFYGVGHSGHVASVALVECAEPHLAGLNAAVSPLRMCCILCQGAAYLQSKFQIRSYHGASLADTLATPPPPI